MLDAAAELAAAAKEAVRLSPPKPHLAMKEPPGPPPAPGPAPSAARPAPPPPPATPREPPPAPPAPPRPAAEGGADPRTPRPRRTPELARVPLHDAEPAPRPAPPRSSAAERIAPENVAGFLPRLAAWLVDSVILLALNLIFVSPVLLILFFRPELKTQDAGSDWTLKLIGALCALVILAANFWYLVGGWAKSGRTPGKALLGLTIVRGDARASGGLGWRTAVVRAIGYALGSLCLMIGFLVVLFRKDRRAWHDLIADTWVVWSK